MLGHKADAIPPVQKASGLHTHKWKVYLKNSIHMKNVNLEKIIEKVVFVIHDSYDPNVIDIFKPPYEINQTGFAGFDVKIIILWRNQVETQFMYNLFLHVNSHSGNERNELVTFSESPHSIFKKYLSKAGARLVSGPKKERKEVSGDDEIRRKKKVLHAENKSKDIKRFSSSTLEQKSLKPNKKEKSYEKEFSKKNKNPYHKGFSESSIKEKKSSIKEKSVLKQKEKYSKSSINSSSNSNEKRLSQNQKLVQSKKKVKSLQTVDLFGGMDASISKKIKPKQEVTKSKSTSLKKEIVMKKKEIKKEVKREIKKEQMDLKMENISSKQEDLLKEKIRKAKMVVKDEPLKSKHISKNLANNTSRSSSVASNASSVRSNLHKQTNKISRNQKVVKPHKKLSAVNNSGEISRGSSGSLKLKISTSQMKPQQETAKKTMSRKTNSDSSLSSSTDDEDDSFESNSIKVNTSTAKSSQGKKIASKTMPTANTSQDNTEQNPRKKDNKFISKVRPNKSIRPISTVVSNHPANSPTSSTTATSSDSSSTDSSSSDDDMNDGTEVRKSFDRDDQPHHNRDADIQQRHLKIVKSDTNKSCSNSPASGLSIKIKLSNIKEKSTSSPFHDKNQYPAKISSPRTQNIKVSSSDESDENDSSSTSENLNSSVSYSDISHEQQSFVGENQMAENIYSESAPNSNNSSFDRQENNKRRYESSSGSSCDDSCDEFVNNNFPCTDSPCRHCRKKCRRMHVKASKGTEARSYEAMTAEKYQLLTALYEKISTCKDHKKITKILSVAQKHVGTQMTNSTSNSLETSQFDMCNVSEKGIRKIQKLLEIQPL